MQTVTILGMDLDRWAMLFAWCGVVAPVLFLAAYMFVTRHERRREAKNEEE